MIRNLLRLVRLVLAAAVVGCVTAPATAEPRGSEPTIRHTTPVNEYDRTPAPDRAKKERPPADPELGVVWIAVGVALFVFMVWVAARIGDND